MKSSSLLSGKKRYSADHNAAARKPVTPQNYTSGTDKARVRQPTHSPYGGASQQVKKRAGNYPAAGGPQYQFDFQNSKSDSKGQLDKQLQDFIQSKQLGDMEQMKKMLLAQQSQGGPAPSFFNAKRM